MNERPSHWRMMEEFNPSLFEKIEPWRQQMLADGVLTRREKELIMSAMCAVVRFNAGFEIHAESALSNGATDAELFEACALTLLIGGVPAYRESVLILEEILSQRS